MQELALAGLIIGSYTGATDPNSSNGITAGLNAMPSKAGGYYFLGASNQFGDYSSNINSINHIPPVEVNDAYLIDTKIDDGKPLTGSMIGFASAPCGSTDSCVGVNICSGSINKALPYLLGNGSSCYIVFALSGEPEFN
jgi:hypothetical protein